MLVTSEETGCAEVSGWLAQLTLMPHRSLAEAQPDMETVESPHAIQETRSSDGGIALAQRQTFSFNCPAAQQSKACFLPSERQQQQLQPTYDKQSGAREAAYTTPSSGTLQSLQCVDMREARQMDSWALSARANHKLRSHLAASPTKRPEHSGIQLGRHLLPLKEPEHAGCPTLVLDLDETLVHTSFHAPPPGTKSFPLYDCASDSIVHVAFRPGIGAFLAIMAELCEIVLFTAGTQEYAQPIIDELDPDESIFTHRLFRHHCTPHKHGFVKDLGLLGRSLDSVIIVDNSPLCYMLHMDNAVPIPTWECDSHDRALLQLIPLLSQLSSVSDVRPHLAARFRVQEGLESCCAKA